MIWLNGDLVEESEAKIPALDSGVFTGDGIFETLRAWRGEPYALTRHYERLRQGATLLGIGIPEKETLADALRAVTRPDAERLRITVTGGGNCIVSASAMPDYSRPAGVSLSSYVINDRSPLAGIKSTSYAANLLVLAQAKANGNDETLLANTRGNLCEGTTSNVFCVGKTSIVTPPLSSGCLPGVTRALVLELCQKLDLPAEERDIPMDELSSYNEIFLTSSLRDIQSVGKEHENSASLYLRRHLQEWREKEIDP